MNYIDILQFFFHISGEYIARLGTNEAPAAKILGFVILMSSLLLNNLLKWNWNWKKKMNQKTFWKIKKTKSNQKTLQQKSGWKITLWHDFRTQKQQNICNKWLVMKGLNLYKRKKGPQKTQIDYNLINTKPSVLGFSDQYIMLRLSYCFWHEKNESHEYEVCGVENSLFSLLPHYFLLNGNQISRQCTVIIFQQI